MLNNAFVLRMAQRFAERLQRDTGDDVKEQVRRAFLLAYGRQPEDEEAGRACQVVRKHGLAVLGRALFNSNEFLYLD
jgi:hypothetical protein